MYLFYGKAAGWSTIAAFLVAMLIFAFCDSFPCKNLCFPFRDRPYWRLTARSCYPDIWLGWWAEANALRPNQDLGKWLGVYTALGVGAIIAVLVGAW